MPPLAPADIACHSRTHIVGARKGIQLSFELIEPVVFLQGHSLGGSPCKNRAAVIRGSLHMKVTEPIKIKQICVYFRGLANLHLSTDIAEKRDLITSGITYFSIGNTAQPANIDEEDLCDIRDRSSTDIDGGQHERKAGQTLPWDFSPPPKYNIDSLHQPSLLTAVHRRSIWTSKPCQYKCHYKYFPAGDYLYAFEFLMHNSLPETIQTELVSTRYFLEAVLEMPGAFSSKIVSQLDVPVVRLPAENAQEMIEPIIISRKWREQLHYDICIFGRCFPLGSRIPMIVKLTPLVDLECHWIRVYVSQHVQYITMGREARRLQLPAKKILLFEKKAGLAAYSAYPGGTMQIMTDKGRVCPYSTQDANLLGKASELSEIELQVQLPRCPEMKEKEKKQWLHFSTKGRAPEVNHWIQLVLCLSMKGKDGTCSGESRPVDLTIESPFTILSCKATPANIYVPQYVAESDIGVSLSQEGQCGCSGNAGSFVNSASTQTELAGDITQPPSLDSSADDIKQPPRAHLAD